VSDELEKARAIVTVTIIGTYEPPESEAWGSAVARTIASVAEEEARKWLDGVSSMTVVDIAGQVLAV
jgi:hypothetical protein